MKVLQEPIAFRNVLPSACTILFLGGLLSWFYSPWSWLGDLSWASIPYGVVLGIVIYLIGFILSCTPWTKTPAMHNLLLTLHSFFKRFTWFQILVVSLLAGVGEELLIRAVLQSYLIEKISPVWGIVCASIVFGALHFMTKTYVLLTFFLGLLFGLSFYYSGSVVLVMVAHTVYDVIAFAMIVKFPHKLGLNVGRETTTVKETATIK